jgi:hypothetical protein
MRTKATSETMHRTLTWAGLAAIILITILRA